MRYACIDIGSNTTRLLVADLEDGALREITTDRSFNGLGATVTLSGRIGADKVSEMVAVAAAQVAAAREHGAEEILAVGTAAVRNAINGDDLAAAFERSTGIELRVLAGEEEARLSFLGATRTGSPVRGPVAVVDVGGGSTELAAGVAGAEPEWWASLPVGSGSLAKECLRSDPPAQAEIDEIRAIVADATRDVAPPPVATARAVGGTAMSLALVAGDQIDAEGLARSLDALGAMTCETAAAHFGVPLDRARLLPAGIVVLERIAALLDAPLRIARGGLREGTLIAACEAAA